MKKKKPFRPLKGDVRRLLNRLSKINQWSTCFPARKQETACREQMEAMEKTVMESKRYKALEKKEDEFRNEAYEQYNMLHREVQSIEMLLAVDGVTDEVIAKVKRLADFFLNFSE